MGWSGGTYSRIYSWIADKAAGVNPQASRFDTDANDMAAAISACLHKGGQNSATADISLGTNKITSLGTPTVGTDAATKDYVDMVGTTGDLKFAIDSTARSGWICYSTDDFTVTAGSEPSIGNALSTGTTRADVDTQDLFNLLYATYPLLVLYDASGTTPLTRVDAATDYAANRRLVLPDILGRSLGIAGTSGDTTNVPTARSTGDSGGAETVTLDLSMIPAHQHSVSHSPSYLASGGGFSVIGSGGTNIQEVASSPNTGTAGTGGSHNNLTPMFFLHLHMKL